MARQISQSAIDDQTLSYIEAKWLADRGRLPKGYPMPDPDEVDDNEFVPPPSKVTPLEEQSVPTIEARGGIVDDEEDEQYEDGWNNDQRRAELSKRGLSVDGRKDDFIARLRRFDTGQLLDEDYSTLDD